MSQFAKTNNRKKRRVRRKGKGLNNKQKAQVVALIEQPAEKKFYDTSFDAESILLTPSFYDLTAPAEGTGSDQLVGSTIDLKSLQYRFTFVRGDDTNYVRYMIFQWRPDSQNDFPSWAQMMQFQVSGFPLGLTEIMSPYILGDGGTNNFKVLVDDQFYIDADNPIQIIKGFINKGYNKKLEVNGPVQQGTNHLFLMFVSDSTMISHPLVYGYTRARYYDS